MCTRGAKFFLLLFLDFLFYSLPTDLALKISMTHECITHYIRLGIIMKWTGFFHTPSYISEQGSSYKKHGMSDEMACIEQGARDISSPLSRI